MFLLSFTIFSYFSCVGLGREAYAIEMPTPSAIAEEALNQLVSSAISTQQSHKTLVYDLIARWFKADSTKRAKVPVTYTGMGQAITPPNSADIIRLSGDLEEFAAYFHDLSGSEQLDKWMYYFGSSGDDFLGPASSAWMNASDYLMNSYTSGGTVEYGSLDESAQWMYWYDWFEGTSSGGNLELISNVVEVYYFAGYDKFGASNSYSISSYNSLNTDASNKGIGYFLLLRLPTRSGNWSSTASILYGSASPISYTVAETGSSTGSYPIYQVTVTTNGMLYATPTSTSSYFEKSSFSQTYDGSVTYTKAGSSSSDNYNVIGIYASDLGVGNTEPVWPVFPRPETPDEPYVPSQPTNITINWNNNSYTNNQTTTTTVDLQPILDAIRIVNDNLESGFLGLGADIRSCYDGITQTLENWLGYLGQWLQTISGQLDEWFRLFLKELRTGNSWLQAIFYKIYGGNSSQPDVTSDTDNYWSWLYELLARIIEMLPDSVQSIITELARLQNYFPFCVPWDVAFLLGLLDAEPVTPVIHAYLPTFGAGGFVSEGVPLTIDLTEFDDIALLLRRAELIFFAITLLPTTYDVLKGFKDVLYS